MVTQSDNEYKKQVDEVVREAGEGMPKIPPFLKRDKKVERVTRKEKELPTENS